MPDNGKNPPSTASCIDQLIRMLSPEERMLVVLKRELYDDDWQAMKDDLSSRLSGGPYVFRLATRIEDDLVRIERLEEIEARFEFNLADYVEP